MRALGRETLERNESEKGGSGRKAVHHRPVLRLGRVEQERL